MANGPDVQSLLAVGECGSGSGARARHLGADAGRAGRCDGVHAAARSVAPYSIALTMSSTTFLASPNTIIVLSM